VEPVVVACMLDKVEAHAVVGFELSRELGRPPRASVDVRLLDFVDPQVLVGLGGSLQFGHGTLAHRIKGTIVSAMSIATPAAGADRQWSLRVEIVSQLGVLEHSVSSTIFQDKSVPDIVKAVLAEHGIPDTAQKWKLSATYPKREYCVQYEESALDFVNRLLEKEGIFYSFRATDEDETIVFEDDSTACDPLDGDPVVAYVTTSAQQSSTEAIQAIVETHRVESGKITLRDYDFKRPDLDLTCDAEADVEPALELFDYPGGYVEQAEGKRYAKVQLEAEQCRRKILEVRGDVARLCEGRKLTLSHAPRTLDGEYVVARVIHRYDAVKAGDDPGARASWLKKAAHRAAGSDASQPSLGMEAELVPAKVPFRRRASTKAPIIDGPQTATVVAPEGSEPEEIHVDEHGRVKVKFHWDLAAAQDDKASCWIRTQQLQTSGSMILPRVDWEVVVEFQQGDPDRPIITGRMYNGRYKPPYELPGGKTRTSLQSSSSPGGGGSNEIRFEDSAGSEEVSIKAQKNQTLATGNNKTKSTGNDEKQSVAANRTIDIGANQTIRVTSGFLNTVAGTQSQTVGANRKIGVNAVLGLSSPSMTGSVGGNQFEMDGNPIAGLIDLAAEKATEAAKAKAAEQMKKLDAAVKEKVDAVMGPIDKVTNTLDKVGKGMEAAKNGDLSGAASAASEAAGLPTPDQVMDDMKSKAVGKAKDAWGKVPGHAFAEDAADEAGVTGEDAKATKAGKGGEEGGGEGGDEGGEGGGGGGGDEGFSKASGLNDMVNSGIENAVSGAAGGLKDALGVGQSGKVVPGPPGGVSGNAEADNTCGPGHSIHKSTSTYAETIGSIRATIALDSINTNIGGDRTQDIGAARVELVNGTRAESCDSKTETALGLVVITGGDEAESVGGANSTMVGGAILAKVGGSAKVAAGGAALFVGALHKVDASGKITFNCGGSSVVIDGGGITMESATIRIAGASVKLTKSVAQGPGAGAGGGGGAGPGDGSGGAGGEGGGPGAGGGGGGGGGGPSGGTGQDAQGPDKRAGGADQGKGGRKPPGARKGDPEPHPDTRKLAAEPNANPDDGKNADRRKARQEVNDHYHDNHHKRVEISKGEDGQLKHEKKDPTPAQIKSDRDYLDPDKPIKYTPPGEKDHYKGGPGLSGQIDPKHTDGKPGYPADISPKTTPEEKKEMDDHAKKQKDAGKAIMDD
jgi:type VI secretion system secreted protein VgrG